LGYKYGKLEFKTVRFEHKHLNQSNYQGVSVMNYTDCNISFSRIIELNYFECLDTETTLISHEYPTKHADVTAPY
jgi:UDP-galactopyranose mutase